MEAIALLFARFLAIILTYYLFVTSRVIVTTEIQHLPEPGSRCPIVGHLPLLQGNEPLALTFAALANKFGPVFTIRMGAHRTLVVSSWELAKECFGTNDTILATRPRSVAGKYMAYNHTMIGIVPNGPVWTDSWKLATFERLSSHRLELLKHLRSTEARKVDMKAWFQDMTFNTIVMMISGKWYPNRTSPQILSRRSRLSKQLVSCSC